MSQSQTVSLPLFPPRRGRWAFRRGVFVMDGDRDTPGWLKMEVSIGNLMIVVTGVVSLTIWAVTASGRADQAGQDLKDFKGVMEHRFDGVDKRLDGIDLRTVIIPTQQDRVETLIKQHDGDMSRLSAMDRRIGDIEQRAAETATRLDGVLHPSLPPVRTTR